MLPGSKPLPRVTSGSMTFHISLAVKRSLRRMSVRNITITLTLVFPEFVHFAITRTASGRLVWLVADLHFFVPSFSLFFSHPLQFFRQSCPELSKGCGNSSDRLDVFVLGGELFGRNSKLLMEEKRSPGSASTSTWCSGLILRAERTKIPVVRLAFQSLCHQ